MLMEVFESPKTINFEIFYDHKSFMVDTSQINIFYCDCNMRYVRDIVQYLILYFAMVTFVLFCEYLIIDLFHFNVQIEQ